MKLQESNTLKLKQQLKEALSSVVYHATSVPSALKILSTYSQGFVKLKASSVQGQYYISFSRNRTGEFPEVNFQGPFVVLELDGNAINHYGKGKAVDSFQEPGEYEGPSVHDYQEDRLYLKKPELDLKTRVLKKVHVVVNGLTHQNIAKIRPFYESDLVSFYSTIADFKQCKTIEKPSAMMDVHQLSDEIIKKYRHDNFDLLATISQFFHKASKEDMREVVSALMDASGIRDAKKLSDFFYR